MPAKLEYAIEINATGVPGEKIAQAKEGASVNPFLARRLREVADLLAQQDENPFRLQAYRNAARRIESYAGPVEELYAREGEEGLKQRLGIGERLASSLSELIQTGKLRLLDRLRGETDPEKLLATVPGIGALWAARLHREHHISWLEARTVPAGPPFEEACAWTGLPGESRRRLKTCRSRNCSTWTGSTANAPRQTRFRRSLPNV